MKKVIIALLIIQATTLSACKQQTDTHKNQFDQLLTILNKENILKDDMLESWEIVRELYLNNYMFYIDSVKDGISYTSHSLSKTYSDICIKAGNNTGIDYYFKYMDLTSNSAEEERSFALERIFVQYPEIVLNKIGKNEDLLNDLTWGFINNRYYGAQNPFDNKDYTAITTSDTSNIPKLNKDNCKDIFYETNPGLKNKYEKYKYQIDYIINNSVKELTNW
jgi:hypothetical protein